ncbi:MAG: hypothetical protein EP300_11860 [Gammaproteobacteria bacterium]|nr:MAG: hypothetical protein EP300_11860 [Gammaproteobacteria bacterium]
MNINGIWKVEILTMYDWEPRATAYFRDGIYWGASAEHYAVGTYTVDGTKFVSDLSIITHGKSRTLFGKKADHLDIVIEADVSGDKFIGTASDKNGAHLVQYRFIKLSDLP